MLESPIQTDNIFFIFFSFSFEQLLPCISLIGENYPKNEQKHSVEKVEECNLHTNREKKKKDSSFIEQNCANRKSWIKGRVEGVRKYS